MERIKIAQIFADQEQFGGKEVLVSGWARTIRDMKTFGFVELNDGSCFKNLQIVLDANALDNYREIAGQNVGAALSVTGTVVLTPEAKQPLEVKAASVAVEGPSAPEYPLQKKRHSVEYLRTIAHLRPRTNRFSAAFRVRSVAAHAIHCFFQDRGFVYVHTPIITASDCEGAGEMFRVTTLDLENPPRTEDGKVDYSQDFFGKPANLTVSGQLNAENFAMAFGDVYTFGPTFRAENSNTQRHAAEFWMIEPEMAFCDLKGRHGRGRGHDQAHHPHRHGEVPRRDQLLQLLRGQGPQGAAGACGLLRLRPGELHRGGGAAQTEQRQVRLQGGVGHRPPDRA